MVVELSRRGTKATGVIIQCPRDYFAWQLQPYRKGGSVVNVHAMIKILCNEGPGATPESPREIPLLPPKTTCGGPLGTRFLARLGPLS